MADSGRRTDWRTELRSRGYRLTPQRELVLEAVDALTHATPEEILGYVRRRSAAVNASTVYRTLEVLEELGVVRHAHLGAGAPTYHSTAVPDHVHLVCRTCQRVIDAEPGEFQPLADTLRARHGFATDITHLTVFGTCEECTG